MGTTTISCHRDIAASPQEVFAVTTNLEKWADVIPAIDKIEILTDGPLRVGTRFRETRTMFGREATEEMEFLELDPPNRYLLGAESHGCRYRTEFALTPQGDGTRITMTFNATPLTFFAKVMAFLMKPMMKKMLDLIAKDLDAVKEHIESKAA